MAEVAGLSEMSEMKLPPEIVFAEQLEEAFSSMANEAFSPPHTIDAETMRQIKEGIAAARARWRCQLACCRRR
jgi:hypothetical protein